MNNNPLISVIVPVYNVEKYLRKCLDSIIDQTLKDIEIICVDDGSTDKSLKILKEYEEKDSRIIILTQQNQYAGVARNNGAKIARGEYLSFLDSDDFFDPHMLEEMYNQAEKDNSDIVICGWKNYNNEAKVVTKEHTINPKFTTRSPFAPTEFANELFSISKPNPWTKLFRHKFFKDNNLQFEPCICCNDLTCVCTAMVLAKKISVMDKNFVFYRNNRTDNLTAHRHKNFEATLSAIKKLEENLKSVNLYNTFRNTFLTKAKTSFVFGMNRDSDEENMKKIIMAGHMLSNELYNVLYDYIKICRTTIKSPKKKFF